MAIDISTATRDALLGALMAYTGWKEWQTRREAKREKKMREELGIPDNPTSCKDHEVRLRALETTCADIKTDVAVIKTDVRAVKEDIADIQKRLP